MRLLPIPTTLEAVKATAPHWLAFLPKIAARTKEPTAQLIDKVVGLKVQPILIWDETTNAAVAMLGISYHYRGSDLIAEWVWMTGTGRKEWQGLLGELERYLREHVRAVELRPICRPGWSRLLKQHGYKTTHIIMEKVF